MTWVELLPITLASFLQPILCTLMGLLSYAIHKHSSRSQHISVLTTCTFMFRQVFTIEPSFFKTTSGVHRQILRGSTSSLSCTSLYWLVANIQDGQEEERLHVGRKNWIIIGLNVMNNESFLQNDHFKKDFLCGVSLNSNGVSMPSLILFNILSSSKTFYHLKYRVRVQLK